MNCQTCKAETSADAKFCAECGAALERRCPDCGASHAARAKFCSHCGRRFEAEAAPPPAAARPSSPSTAVSAPNAERRQLTVLFCDLAGSTELSKRLDPEDFRDVLLAYHEAAQTVIARFSGHVAQFLGDGVLAYFGYPQAHEDDARRSILTGLGIVDAVATVNERFQRDLGVKVAVRVGIHTGATVVGPVGSGDGASLAMGSTPNMAAAIQTAAAPDTVVASAATVRLVRGAFQCDPLGARAVKPGVEPVELFRMRHLPRIATRLDLLPVPAPSSLVGRGLEMGLLTGRWAETRAGRGRLVLVSGDAGIGKSRLVQAFRDSVKDDPHHWLEGRCSPYHADSALRPMAEVLAQLAGIPEESNRETTQAALEALLGQLGLANSSAIALCGGLLGLDAADPAAVAALSPQVRRGRTLELLLSVLLKSAEKRPLVLMLEDMHWVDQSTVDFIGHLTERMARAPIFLLLTARPEFRPSWNVDAEVALRRLPRDEAERMVSTLAGERALLADVMAHIVERSDGNPLFVEELTRMVLESGQLATGDAALDGGDGTAALAVPTTLRDSLMARLDRLGPAKLVAQFAATIGRQFSFAQLAELTGAAEVDLRRDLEKLLESEIIYGRGAPPISQYTFKHALIQEAAYGSLTRRTRRTYHERLCQQLGGKPGTPPEVLAHHFSEAGHPREAVRNWVLAGQRALGAFALVESIHHLERGLAVTREQLGGGDAVSAELDVRLVLGVSLMLTRGFAAPEVEAHYQRVFELCHQVGEGAAAQLFPAYWGLWTFYEVSASYAKAEEMGTRILELAERVGDTGIRLAGYTAHAAAILMRGRLAEARDEFEKGLAIYEMPRHKALAMLFGQDAGAMCAAFLTWVYAHEGDDAAAERCARQAVDLYERIGHPGTEGFVECVLASYRSVTGDFDGAELHARRVMALAEQQGMPHWAAQGRVNLGWAMQGRGLAVEGAEQIRGGIAALAQIGTRASFTYFEGALAAAELRAGRPSEALTVLERAFAFAESTGEHFYLAELYRLKGEVLLALGNGDGDDGAERAFREALTVAREQGAAAFLRRTERSLRALGARPAGATLQ